MLSRKRAVMLGRAYSADVSILGVVRESQFSNEAVTAHAEVPDPLRHRTRELSIRRHEATGDDAHLLFRTAYDLAGVYRQAVWCLHLRYAIDDGLVVAGRRAHEAHRCAAPDTHCRHRMLSR